MEMLSFKKFIMGVSEERNSLSVQSTMRAIDSQSDRYQRQFNHPNAPKHIPLKGHKGAVSDHFWDTYKERTPELGAYKKRTFKLGDLTPSQPNVHINKLSVMRKKLLRPKLRPRKAKDEIRIASLTGEDGVKRHFVLNGHHSLYALAVRHGPDHAVRVKHVDLDEHE